MGEKLKYYKHPIYRNGKLVYKAYVAMRYLDNNKDFETHVYIKKKKFWLFWVKVNEDCYRNIEPIEATQKVIKEYEGFKRSEKYQTHKVNVHMVNFMDWDGELES